jgi:hypothetical protein
MWLRMSDEEVRKDLRSRRVGRSWRHRIYHWRLEQMIMSLVCEARLMAPVCPDQVRRMDGACVYLLSLYESDEVYPIREIRKGLREVLADVGYVEAMCAMYEGLVTPLLGLHYPDPAEAS